MEVIRNEALRSSDGVHDFVGHELIGVTQVFGLQIILVFASINLFDFIDLN